MTFATLNELISSAAISTPQTYVGPDARWQSIELFDNGHSILRLGSWHELYETNPNLVATETGIVPLNGRERDIVLAAQSEAYRSFRRNWQSIKQVLLALIPASAVAYNPVSHRPLPWSSTY